VKRRPPDPGSRPRSWTGPSSALPETDVLTWTFTEIENRMDTMDPDVAAKRRTMLAEALAALDAAAAYWQQLGYALYTVQARTLDQHIPEIPKGVADNLWQELDDAITVGKRNDMAGWLLRGRDGAYVFAGLMKSRRQHLIEQIREEFGEDWAAELRFDDTASQP
jgi:hypothetical protein